ncbi:hypothetical protein NBRC116590_15530 [Pelagimonas sp. KU-00592-HH]|jgi:Flp pilus assembly pilin Flp|uniref:hypothetical protein n=1 Tax=Roseobacteraceae TaxID=2854170 RepID=UPI0020CD4912|nr:hypothetical protein [Shimia sp. CNT1-13L.2]MCP9483720.1 hypothetical protein [Shimia sp. CNT1-13L.2]
MKRFLRKFSDDDKGAVTVDWVVITAGVVSLGIAVTTLITTNTETLASSAATAIAASGN